jgi:hypothetical protein
MVTKSDFASDIIPLQLATPEAGISYDKYIRFKILHQGVRELYTDFEVWFFDENDVAVQTEYIKSGVPQTFTVSNDTPVKANGDYCLDENGKYTTNHPDYVCGEYDFIRGYIMMEYNILDLLVASIERLIQHNRI